MAERNPNELLNQKKYPLTLIQPGKGRFTLNYMSHDYLHGLHTGLSCWIKVKILSNPDLGLIQEFIWLLLNICS